MMKNLQNLMSLSLLTVFFLEEKKKCDDFDYSFDFDYCSLIVDCFDFDDHRKNTYFVGDVDVDVGCMGHSLALEVYGCGPG